MALPERLLTQLLSKEFSVRARLGNLAAPMIGQAQKYTDLALRLACMVLFCLIAPGVAAQSVPEVQVKAAVTLRFFNHIEWENDSGTGAFSLGFYGEDEEIFDALESLAAGHTERGRPIHVLKVNDFSEMPDFHMIFVSRDKASQISQLARSIRRTYTLIVSEEAADHKNVMINFLRSSGRVRFEVNRSNIIYEHLKMDPELLKHGGTELDVAELYREMETELATMREAEQRLGDRFSQQQRDLAKLEQSLSSADSKNQQLQRATEELTATLAQQQTLLKARESALIGANKAKTAIEKRIARLQENLVSTTQDLKESTAQLPVLIAQLEDKNSAVEKQTEAIAQNEKQIEAQEDRLLKLSEDVESQSSIIDLQGLGLWFAALVVVLVSVLFARNISFSRKVEKLNLSLEAAKNNLETQVKVRTLQIEEHNEHLQLIGGLQESFLLGNDMPDLFARLLDEYLARASSTVGFIGEMVSDETQPPYLNTYAVSSSTGNGDNKQFYRRKLALGEENADFGNLLRRCITAQEIVISNSPLKHMKNISLGNGYPPLECFMTVPFFARGKMIGMIGVANKEGGYTDLFAKQLKPLTQTISTMVDAELRRHKLAKAEERIRQTLKMEAVGQLTGGIAHDFNNLLSVINGNLDILQEDVSEGVPLNNELIMEFVAPALRAGRRAALLTERLLAFSRKTALRPEIVDLRTVVTNMRPLIEHGIKQNIDFVIQAPESPVFVEVDVPQLENALLNLVVNSRDAMTEGGQLTIKIEVRGTANGDVKHGCLVVMDTGVGMDESTLSCIFEPFYTTKEVGKGTGLGLSMVFGFAQQSGGRLDASSVLGEGTSMTLSFPTVSRVELGDRSALGAHDAP